MKKFIVETYYTCTFKTVHTLDNLNDQELTNIDKRNDGEVEVIDVKLNNRKTRKVGDKNVNFNDLLLAYRNYSYFYYSIASNIIFALFFRN